MTDTEAETQEEEEAGSTQGARRGTQSRVPGITPWAGGGAKPAGPPVLPSPLNLSNKSFLSIAAAFLFVSCLKCLACIHSFTVSQE